MVFCGSLIPCCAPLGLWWGGPPWRRLLEASERHGDREKPHRSQRCRVSEEGVKPPGCGGNVGLEKVFWILYVFFLLNLHDYGDFAKNKSPKKSIYLLDESGMSGWWNISFILFDLRNMSRCPSHYELERVQPQGRVWQDLHFQGHRLVSSSRILQSSRIFPVLRESQRCLKILKCAYPRGWKDQSQTIKNDKRIAEKSLRLPAYRALVSKLYERTHPQWICYISTQEQKINILQFHSIYRMKGSNLH